MFELHKVSGVQLTAKYQITIVSLVCEFWFWQFLSLTYITHVHKWSQLEKLLFCLCLPTILFNKFSWFPKYFPKYKQISSLI